MFLFKKKNKNKFPGIPKKSDNGGFWITWPVRVTISIDDNPFKKDGQKACDFTCPNCKKTSSMPEWSFYLIKYNRDDFECGYCRVRYNTYNFLPYYISQKEWPKYEWRPVYDTKVLESKKYNRLNP